MNLTKHITQQILSYSFEAISPEGIEVAKHCILDWTGVCLAAQDQSVTKMLKDELSDNRASAALIGGGTASMYNACLINGTAGHVLDYDDTNPSFMGHPTGVLFPALMALGTELQSSGKDILVAFITGYEAGCLLASVLGLPHYQQGFHGTATVGTIGAAAACAKLMGLNKQQTSHALGLATCQSAGLKSMFGTDGKSLQVGKASMNGLLSARLAARGMDAPEDGFGDEQGFLNTHHSDGGKVISFKPGELVAKTLFKFHSSCHNTHAGIDAMNALRQEGLSPEDIQSITLNVPVNNLKQCGIEHPETALATKFSQKHTVAMALHGVDTSALSSFSLASSKDLALKETRNKIIVIGDKPFGLDTDITVELKDGSVRKKYHNTWKAETDLPLQRNRLEKKFLSVTRSWLSEADQKEFISINKSMEKVEGILDVMNLITT